MELRFLGRGAAFLPGEGNTSAYMREGEKLLLLDCGSDVFGKLIALGTLHGVKELTVAISHLHGDHVGSLDTLGLYCAHQLHIPMRLAVPQDEEYLRQLAAVLALNGCGPECYRMTADADVTDFAAFTAMRFVPTRHAPGMRCFSIAFETPEGGVFYSADTAVAEPMLDFIAAHDRISALYTDVTDSPVPGGVHLGLSTLEACLPVALRARTHLMHFNSPACIEAGRALGFAIVETER